MEKPILIASATSDEDTYGPVSSILERRGFPVVVYRTDKLLSGEDQFVVDVTSDGGPTIEYNGASIHPDNLSAAWYRKIAGFTLPDAEQQLSKQLHMNNEVRALHDTIWPLFYPEDIWLNAPANLERADRKLGQLLVAHEVGFSVPNTVVSSDWDVVIGKFLTDDSHMIVKMMRGVLSEDNKIKVLHTTIVDHARAQGIKDNTSPFPGLYQPFVPKAREWRVTAVGDNVFPIAIYTDEAAKNDWRKLQETEAVRFRSEKLPEGIGELCIAYLDKMKLRYGAFDLVETPDGETVFLECNPNGQYSWLEEDLGIPVSSAIADELVNIAHSRR